MHFSYKILIRKLDFATPDELYLHQVMRITGTQQKFNVFKKKGYKDGYA